MPTSPTNDAWSCHSKPVENTSVGRSRNSPIATDAPATSASASGTTTSHGGQAEANREPEAKRPESISSVTAMNTTDTEIERKCRCTVRAMSPINTACSAYRPSS